MSAESDVAIVRRGFDAFETMDMEAFTADWDPDVVWDVSGYEGWPGSKRAYRGAPEILAEFGRFMTTVRSLEVEGLEIRPAGDRTLALYTERRRDAGSSDPVELEVGIVYTIRDGRVVRMEVYTGHDNARRAAGLD